MSKLKKIGGNSGFNVAGRYEEYKTNLYKKATPEYTLGGWFAEKKYLVFYLKIWLMFWL